MADGSDLVVLERATALDVFTGAEKIDPILASIRAKIDAFEPDVTTKGGRSAIASMAHKVAQSKTYLDGIGKELADVQKEIPRRIDASRKRIRDTLDAWKDEVRRPLTEWEDAEEARTDRHKAGIAELIAVAADLTDRPSALLRERLAEVKAEDISESAYEEFAGDAAAAKVTAIAALEARIAKTEEREAEQAELARLRAEALASKKAEAEAKAKRDAEERERFAAERASNAERAKIAAEQAAARAAAEQREREHTEALAAAERRAVEAASQAKAEIEATAKREAEEKARREADRKHKATINRQILAAFVECGVAADVAKQIITLIASHRIPSVTINY